MTFTAAKIGEGVLLDHGTGVVIGETAVVGNRVSLMQVTSSSLFLHHYLMDILIILQNFHRLQSVS